MPPRSFDGKILRSHRGAMRLNQQELGDRIGVTGAVIGNWEAERTHPQQEKLPALAAALQQPVDNLFPRWGLPPDLADLRCDAGLSLHDVRPVLNARSDSILHKAESGRQRLARRHHEPLAQAYGVSVEEIVAAQDRSCGQEVPAVVDEELFEVPRTIAERIRFMLEQTYLPAWRPTDAQLADRGNAATASAVLTEDLVHQLRTGGRTTATPAQLRALTASMEAPAAFFGDDEIEVRRIVAAIRMMKAFDGLTKQGGDTALRPESSPVVRAFIRDVINQPAPN